MKTNLKENIYIEGFDSLESGYIIQDIIAKKCEEFIYAGKTSEIPEEIAKECVESGVCNDSGPHGLGFFNYYREYPNELHNSCLFSAKESIQYACDKEYCIIYKI